MTELSAGFVPWSRRLDGEVVGRPVMGGDLVYAATGAGTVHALRAASGETVWTRHLDEPPASAPVVAHDTVLVTAGERDRHGNGAGVVALDAATGDPRWDDPHGGGWCDAAVDDDGRVLVATGHTTVRAVDPDTGATAWRTDLAAHELASDRSSFFVLDPVAAEGGRVVVHLDTSVCYGLDGGDGTVLWRTAYGSYYDAWTPAVVHDGVVYVGTGDGGLVALDAATGARRAARRPQWEELHAGVGWPDPRERSPVIDHGPVVAGTSAGASVWMGARNGFLCAYDTGGRTLHLLDNLPARWGAPAPVAAGDRVVAVWPGGHMAAYDATDRERLWTARDRKLSTLPAATAEMFCYGRGRTLVAHPTATGPATSRRLALPRLLLRRRR